MKISTYLLISGAVIAQACSTCPPCVPTHEIVEVLVPVSSCPAPPELPPVVLPDWPILVDDATAEETKTWYVDMVETMYARFAILTGRIDGLNQILASYGDVPE